MKKLMYIAAALLVLVGCNKKENVIENAPQNLVTITGGIDFSAQDGPNKVVAKDGWETASTVEFIWEEGDEIAVINEDWTECHKFTVSKILNDGKTAEFTGEPLSGGMEKFIVEYPYELGEADCISEEVGYELFKHQQYTGKFKPSGWDLECSNNTFTLDLCSVFDLSLIGNAKLGKINYYLKIADNAYESDLTASISMGEDGLQLTNEPQHITFAMCLLNTLGFKLCFYDTEDQLILEKEVAKNLLSSILNTVISFPTLEVNAATPTHAYVDLGLPSGIMWATCNVGATAPEGYGDYFAWGETAPYYNTPITNPITWKEGKTSGYAWPSYSGADDFVEWNPAPYDDNKILKSEYDAATVNWGGDWRMPTKAEWDELMNTENCKWEWKENYNSTGVEGYLVTSLKEGYTNNSIFLPAAGYGDNHEIYVYDGDYWASSLIEDIEGNGYYLYFTSEDYSVSEYGSDRFYGISVRPVYNVVYK